MTDYSAVWGRGLYDIVVSMAKQHQLDPSQVMFGYLQVVSEVTGSQDSVQADLHDPQVRRAINEQFSHFLNQRH